MVITQYNRQLAVNYAKQWAFKRNPKYFNFDNLGGDCTNFVSQCIYAGSSIMNFSPIFGWYYNNLSDRTPSWTGVEYLYNFLISNKNAGPFGNTVDSDKTAIGDIIELGNTSVFYHSMIITNISNGIIYTASHTSDSFDRPLSSYRYNNIRYLHIDGVRK